MVRELWIYGHNSIINIKWLMPGKLQNFSYKKPSAKAPVIDPGDEAPFLVWEVRGRGGKDQAT